MDRLERLVNLVAALLDAERPLGRDELRRRVGGYADDADAFRRTFERDKDVLRQMGMPLVTEPIDPDHPDDNVGYRIPRERYELTDPGLDDDELAALHLAASAVAVEGAWGRDASTSALRKLAGVAAGRSSALAAAGPPGDLATLPGGDRVAAAFAAVADRRQLAFGYRSERRLIEPWRLSYRKGQWYLSGLDRARSGERMFRLDRVQGELEPVGPAAAFERPPAPALGPPAPWRLGDGDEVPVEVVVDASHASWVVEEVGNDAVVEPKPNGAVHLTLPVNNRDGLRSFVLGLLEHAEVVGPPDVRADIVTWLDQMAGRR